MYSLFTEAPVADSGLGWQLVDKEHNLPPSGPFVPSVDFTAVYKKAWGVWCQVPPPQPPCCG